MMKQRHLLKDKFQDEVQKEADRSEPRRRAIKVRTDGCSVRGSYHVSRQRFLLFSHFTFVVARLRVVQEQEQEWAFYAQSRSSPLASFAAFLGAYHRLHGVSVFECRVGENVKPSFIFDILGVKLGS